MSTLSSAVDRLLDTSEVFTDKASHLRIRKALTENLCGTSGEIQDSTKCDLFEDNTACSQTSSILTISSIIIVTSLSIRINQVTGIISHQRWVLHEAVIRIPCPLTGSIKIHLTTADSE